MSTPSERMTQEHLDAILAELRTTHPRATAATVVEWLDYDWSYPAEHETWAATAPAGEIATWIAAGLDRER